MTNVQSTIALIAFKEDIGQAPAEIIYCFEYGVLAICPKKFAQPAVNEVNWNRELA